jgi:hypothetical protein
MRLVLQPLTKLICEIVEIARLGKGAKHHEDDLPLAQVGVLHDVGEVFGDD